MSRCRTSRRPLKPVQSSSIASYTNAVSFLENEGGEMLVLSRKDGDVIHIGNDILVRVISSDFGRVKLGVEAPDNVDICRGEIRSASRHDANDKGCRMATGRPDLCEAAECLSCGGDRQICPRCDGIGLDSVESRTSCGRCGGKGELTCPDCGL